MRPLPTFAAIALVTALAAPAAADMCVVKERDGTTTVTSDCGRRGARVLYRETRRAPDATPSARARPARAREPQNLADRARRYAALVSAAAAHYALPEPLVWAVMKAESNFQPDVVSHRGAQGLMQLMPPTAGDMGVTDAFDPEQNIFGGARFLRILANKFDGDLVKTLAGYHAGGGAVSLTNGIPYEQTAEYVRRVLNHYYAYQKRLPTE